ncbi:hypothetical protein [Wolbachia endosymbiont of Dactylopius coccus]
MPKTQRCHPSSPFLSFQCLTLESSLPAISSKTLCFNNHFLC